jgi:hypothetical protein
MSQPSLCEVRVRGGLLPVWIQADGPTALVFLHYWGGSRRTSLEANLLPVIPGARMTVLDGTGHLSPLEVPDQIATRSTSSSPVWAADRVECRPSPRDRGGGPQ